MKTRTKPTQPKWIRDEERKLRETIVVTKFAAYNITEALLRRSPVLMAQPETLLPLAEGVRREDCGRRHLLPANRPRRRPLGHAAAGLDLVGTTEAHRGLVRAVLAQSARSRPRTKQNSGGVHDTVDNTWAKLAWRIAGGVRANERERQQEHAERAKEDAAR